MLSVGANSIGASADITSSFLTGSLTNTGPLFSWLPTVSGSVAASWAPQSGFFPIVFGGNGTTPMNLTIGNVFGNTVAITDFYGVIYGASSPQNTWGGSSGHTSFTYRQNQDAPIAMSLGNVYVRIDHNPSRWQVNVTGTSVSQPSHSVAAYFSSQQNFDNGVSQAIAISLTPTGSTFSWLEPLTFSQSLTATFNSGFQTDLTQRIAYGSWAVDNAATVNLAWQSNAPGHGRVSLSMMPSGTGGLDLYFSGEQRFNVRVGWRDGTQTALGGVLPVRVEVLTARFTPISSSTLGFLPPMSMDLTGGLSSRAFPPSPPILLPPPPPLPPPRRRRPCFPIKRMLRRSPSRRRLQRRSRRLTRRRTRRASPPSLAST